MEKIDWGKVRVFLVIFAVGFFISAIVSHDLIPKAIKRIILKPENGVPMLRHFNFKKTVKKIGFFEVDQKNESHWLFHPFVGDALRVANSELVPIDLYSDYKVTGTIDKIDANKLKIIRVIKIIDNDSRNIALEYNTIY